MNDASTRSIGPAAARPSGLGKVIAPGFPCASVLYLVATSESLPRIPDASAAIDVFLAAVVPGLMVVMLLWAARPAAYPQRRRLTLVAVTLIGAAAAASLPILFPAA